MGNISWNGSFASFGTDETLLQVKKVRAEGRCRGCGKTISKGSYAFGDVWGRRCLECGLKLCDNTIIGLKDWIKRIELEKINVLNNKDEWELNNLQASI